MEPKIKQRIVGFAILILVLVVVGIILFTGSKKTNTEQNQTTTTMSDQANDDTNQLPNDQSINQEQPNQPSDNQMNPLEQQTNPDQDQIPNQNMPEQNQNQPIPQAQPESVPGNQMNQMDNQAQPVETTAPVKAATTKTTTHKATKKAPVVAHGNYTVQAASFSSSTNAKKLQQQLNKKGYDAYVKTVKASSGNTMYRVNVGRGITQAEAKKIIAKLEKTAHLNAITAKYKK